mgnify:CR=1 FL=1
MCPPTLISGMKVYTLFCWDGDSVGEFTCECAYGCGCGGGDVMC